MADKMKKAAPRKAATHESGWTPWKGYDVEMLLNTFFPKHFPELSDTLLLRSKFVFSSFEEIKIVRRIHLLSGLRYGLKRMRTSLCSFVSLALSVPVSKKTTCKRSSSVPRFSENRAIFYPFPYKTCAYKRSNFLGTGTHFYPSRSASFDV